MPDAATTIPPALRAAATALNDLLADPALLADLDRGAELLAGALRRGGKILACGNGGSACDAAHFAEELTGRFRSTRRPLAAIACTDAGHLTCTANDFGFDHVFARWVEALARDGDVLVALSTSGNSRNVLLAADAARRAGASVIGLTGAGGGELRDRSSLAVVVPGAGSDRIQELHMLVLHAWVEAVEAALGLA